MQRKHIAIYALLMYRIYLLKQFRSTNFSLSPALSSVASVMTCALFYLFSKRTHQEYVCKFFGKRNAICTESKHSCVFYRAHLKCCFFCVRICFCMKLWVCVRLALHIEILLGHWYFVCISLDSNWLTLKCAVCHSV